jgi:phosphohistidine phosphatase
MPRQAEYHRVMQLFVVRHAIAAPMEPGDDDALRPLTKKGVRRFRQGVSGLATLGVEVSVLLHSPWRRAVETAMLMEPMLMAGASVHATPLLCRSPGPELLALITEAGGAPNEAAAREGFAAAVVGHEPFLGELVGWLTSGELRGGESLTLKKGSVTWLEGSVVAGGMSLLAVLPPRVLRALGK